ncbi:hypothetical protein [Pseudarthrobacter sp. NPDC080039]|uniref:hypothetical protein n=1 Tax=unclassified Pseudarthrobacter TaxID=2647000 RepID=UPI00344CFC0C
MSLNAKKGTASRRLPFHLGECVPSTFEAGVAHVALFFMVFKVPGLSLFPAGAVVALFLLSVGLFRGTVQRTRDLGKLISTSLLAAIVGLFMRFLLTHEGDSLSSELEVLMMVGWVTAMPAIVVAGVWCFERVDVYRGFVLLSAGAATSAALKSNDLSWKFGIGLSLTLLALALAARHGSFWTRLVLSTSAAVSAANDARTMALISITVLACTFIGKRRVKWIRMHPKTSFLGIAVGFAIMSYVMVQSMMSGLFGLEIQSRTIAQTSGGRDLLTSGRSEWAASIELFKQSPFGFGIGVTPGDAMQSDALRAVTAAGGDFTALQYWTVNVFGNRLDLHSNTVDLWAHFGVGGVALAAVMAWIFVKAFPLCVSAVRYLGAVPLFAVMSASWDLLFSPMADSDHIAYALIAAVVLMCFDGVGWPMDTVHPQIFGSSRELSYPMVKIGNDK